MTPDEIPKETPKNYYLIHKDKHTSSFIETNLQKIAITKKREQSCPLSSF